MSDVEQSVLYMKVTEALREPGPQKLEDLAKTYNIADFPNLLYLAVGLSSLDTVRWVAKLYESKNRDVNERDPGTGNTALHEAVATGRAPIVAHLMELPVVDDTIRNKRGLTALEVASSPEMERVLTASENRFAEKLAVRLKRAFKARDVHELQSIYRNPRVSELMNINGCDPETGRTVLHDAAGENDLQLVKFILAHGGDPLIKDRRSHRLAQDLTVNEEIKKLLITTAKSKAILEQTNRSPSKAGTSPAMSGYLKKWTNITTGYKLRWFVLQNGWLSYYKAPEDVKQGERLIRGTIGLRHAIVRMDSSEKNRFEVRTPSVKFHLKATHQAECNKWVWALQNAITKVRDEDKKNSKAKALAASAKKQQSSSSAAASPTSPTSSMSSSSKLKVNPIAAKATKAIASAPSSPTASSKLGSPAPVLAHHHHQHPHSQERRQASVSSLTGPSSASIKSKSGSDNNEMFFNDLSQKGDYESDNYEDEDLDELILKGPRITAESLVSRLAAIKQFLTAISEKNADVDMSDAVSTAQASIDVLSSDVVMFERQSNAAKRIIQAEVEEGDRAQRTWASNYRDLEIQCEQLEGKLHSLRAKYHDEDDDDDEFFDTVENREGQNASSSSLTDSSGETERSGATGTLNDSLGESSRAITPDVSHVAAQEPTLETVSEPTADPSAAEPGDDSANTADVTQDSYADANTTIPIIIEPTDGEASSGQETQENASDAANEGGEGDSRGKPSDANTESSSKDAKNANETSESGNGSGDQGGAGDKDNSKDDDGTNNNGDKSDIARVETRSSGVPASPTGAQQKVLDRILSEHSFNGYEDPPRTRLKIDADNRPKLSLWSILKNLIGKDMTKMTLPVTFNECTSLLQRSAEDMEYVDLLDRAAESVHDPGLRMAYVAAFAGSSYSSTIDRVAKPFNPLLGETYEYCRPDEGFRMFAEQVSHHPPIGALMAESARWDFYGESNVESKFYGRSFDINPLGLWYLCLRPDKGADVDEELYSFRKLTSSVVGIMLGHPVVDNYGEMHIDNYTTGVHAVINYKPRGWRGSSAYKLQGKIYDKDDNVLWTIGGTWNDKMWAKKAGSDNAVMLWKAHPRHRTPFNLTDFAITLNALPDRLKPWLPPTDTRLRPDQRAMEEGRYDDASEEKNRVEEKQRASRRERESKGIQYKPRWFEKTKHPVTGKEYYQPINDYWKLRSEKKLEDKGDIF